MERVNDSTNKQKPIDDIQVIALKILDIKINL